MELLHTDPASRMAWLPCFEPLNTGLCCRPCLPELMPFLEQPHQVTERGRDRTVETLAQHMVL